MTLKKAVEAIESNPSLKQQFIQNCIAEMGEYTYQKEVVWNDYDIENIVIFQKKEIDFSESYYKEALQKTIDTPEFEAKRYNVNKICRDVFDGYSRSEIARKYNLSPWYVRTIIKEFKKHLKEILDRAT